MAKVFGDKIEKMPCELQNILLDDLVTAFENRLDVLSQAQSNLRCVVRFGMNVPYETIQTWNLLRHSRSAGFEGATEANAFDV